MHEQTGKCIIQLYVFLFMLYFYTAISVFAADIKVYVLCFFLFLALCSCLMYKVSSPPCILSRAERKRHWSNTNHAVDI